jgi:hypothetical protein
MARLLPCGIVLEEGRLWCLDNTRQIIRLLVDLSHRRLNKGGVQRVIFSVFTSSMRDFHIVPFSSDRQYKNPSYCRDSVPPSVVNPHHATPKMDTAECTSTSGPWLARRVRLV